jgi:hypothetical protein
MFIVYSESSWTELVEGCEGGGAAYTSFIHSSVLNWPSVEARPLWREVVVSASVIVCDPFSTTVEMEIDQQSEWINIKFLVKLGKSGPKICQMLQHADGEDALKRSTVFMWVQCYRESWEDPTENKRFKAPSDFVHRWKHQLSAFSHAQWSLDDYSNDSRWTSDWKTSVYSILMEDLEMRNICAKIVPKLHTPEQKLRRKQCCIDWKALEEGDAFLERVITGDLGDTATITAESTMLRKGLKEDDFQGCFNQ